MTAYYFYGMLFLYRRNIMPKAKTKEEFSKELKDKYSGKYELVNEYCGSSKKVWFHCNKDLGHQDWKETPTHVLGGRVCPECLGKNIHRTQEQFLKDLEKEHGNIITTNDTFTGVNNKMWFHCNRGIGHKDWRAFPNNILRGQGCPKCGILKRSKSHTKSHEKFIEEFNNISDGTVEIVGKYTGRFKPIETKCKLCGYTWTPNPSDLLGGRGCPNCKSSSGEQTVRAVLEFNNINYDPQHNFKIKDKTHRLDFVLKDNKGSWCVIQPDGIQHTWKYKQFTKDKKEAERSFEDRVARDKDENKYLPALGVRVLRIPWLWFDLDDTFILLCDFLGYDLAKPSKGYVPKYKKSENMINDYLENGDALSIAKKYGVSKTTVINKTTKYIGMSLTEYHKSHPMAHKSVSNKVGNNTPTAVISIDGKGIETKYPSMSQASKETGASSGSIARCLYGDFKTAGGYKWEKAE